MEAYICQAETQNNAKEGIYEKAIDFGTGGNYAVIRVGSGKL